MDFKKVLILTRCPLIKIQISTQLYCGYMDQIRLGLTSSKAQRDETPAALNNETCNSLIQLPNQFRYEMWAITRWLIIIALVNCNIATIPNLWTLVRIRQFSFSYFFLLEIVSMLSQVEKRHQFITKLLLIHSPSVIEVEFVEDSSRKASSVYPSRSSRGGANMGQGCAIAHPWILVMRI